MLGAIKHGLRNLFNGTGRDARQTFWYYVLAVYLVSTALSMVMMVPVMFQAFSGAIEAAQTGASEAQTQLIVQNQMAGMMDSVGWMGMASGLGMMMLLGASFVRRLHDSDLSGWWAVIPAAVQAFAISQMPAQIHAMTTTMANPAAYSPQNPFAAMQAQGSMALLGWIPIVIVIVLGVRKSTEGPNRFGTDPVRF